MTKARIGAFFIFLIAALFGYFVYASESAKDGSLARFPFRFGLDLSGGTHLVYRALVAQVPSGDVDNSMESLRDVIERRVNLFGVAEPVVQVEETLGIISQGKEQRLIVELPGVTDIDKAVAMIGQTPLLEFRLERTGAGATSDTASLLGESLLKAQDGHNARQLPEVDALFTPTELTGRYLKRATLQFDSTTGEPSVLLQFDDEGSELFEKITRENTNKVLAIYLDGAPISLPVIRQAISGGRAEITGQFTPEEAKTLVGRLNSGALPVPIELLSSQTIGASLGEEARERGMRSGIYGIAAVALFMILWYRLPGVIAVAALLLYTSVMLALFKLIPVTITSAGIAGFILSIGMAVDANILIFERMKEELRGREGRAPKEVSEAVVEGFARAWLAIRDSNISSMLTAVILFWFGTSLIKGFALVFGLGVLVSMLTAISVSRTLLLAVLPAQAHGGWKFLLGSGFK